MIRIDIIAIIGREYLTSNIENDEFSYKKAFSQSALAFEPIQNSAGRTFEKLDIRFVKDNVTVLIETKQNYSKFFNGFKMKKYICGMEQSVMIWIVLKILKH